MFPGKNKCGDSPILGLSLFFSPVGPNVLVISLGMVLFEDIAGFVSEISSRGVCVEAKVGLLLEFSTERVSFEEIAGFAS